MGTTTPINVLGPTGQTQELCVYAGVKEVGRIKVLVVICMQRGDWGSRSLVYVYFSRILPFVKDSNFRKQSHPQRLKISYKSILLSKV